mgnify:CR=1 FL=1
MGNQTSRSAIIRSNRGEIVGAFAEIFFYRCGDRLTPQVGRTNGISIEEEFYFVITGEKYLCSFRNILQIELLGKIKSLLWAVPFGSPYPLGILLNGSRFCRRGFFQEYFFEINGTKLS